mgnify:CR=1 FL=1
MQGLFLFKNPWMYQSVYWMNLAALRAASSLRCGCGSESPADTIEEKQKVQRKQSPWGKGPIPQGDRFINEAPQQTKHRRDLHITSKRNDLNALDL